MLANTTVVYKKRTGNIETALTKEESVETGEVWYFVDTYRITQPVDEESDESHDFINNSGSESNKKYALQAFLDDLDCFHNGEDHLDARKELENA